MPNLNPHNVEKLAPHWHKKFVSAQTPEQLMTYSMSYLRASLAQGFPTSPQARDEKRLKVAELLLQIALEP